MYATVEQADEYVEQYYTSTDPLRLLWEGLFEDDKQVLLNRAARIIDGLPLKGHSLESGKAFPRTPFQDISIEMAKIATIELALQSQDQEATDRRKLQSQGVKSYKIGDLSETFSDASSNASDEAFTLSVVSRYLSNWLSGGFPICPTRIRK